MPSLQRQLVIYNTSAPQALDSRAYGARSVTVAGRWFRIHAARGRGLERRSLTPLNHHL